MEGLTKFVNVDSLPPVRLSQIEVEFDKNKTYVSPGTGAEINLMKQSFCKVKKLKDLQRNILIF